MMIDRIKNNKFLLVLLCLITIGLILLIFRVTYAYLMEHLDASDRAKVDINLKDAYSLKFIPGSSLDLDVTAKTLPENGDDLTITSNPSVQLFEPNLGTEHSYNVYLSIPTNPFVYTEEGTPEILLKVQNGEEEIKINNNITYNEDLGGFDITNFKGTIPIIEDCKISSPELKEVTHNWTITLTYRNLDIDQSINLDKTLNVKIIMQEEKKELTLADLCTGQKVSECFTKNYKNDKAIVYHNATAASQDGVENADKVAGDDSYRYSGANPNNYVCFGSKCSDKPSDNSEENGYKNLYRIIGLFKNTSDQYEMKIIKADAATKEDLGEGTYPDSAYYVNYNSFKINYKGKLTTFASYSWNNTSGTDSSDNTNVNMWAASNLNTKNLNTTYYNAIEEPYKTMVVEHEWQVGGTSNTGDAKSIYDSELGDNKVKIRDNSCYDQGNPNDARECKESDLTYSGVNAHVGLMYVSDYMYGTLPQYWTTIANGYSDDELKTNNWLYLGINEWTISRDSANGNIARDVNHTGYAYNGHYVYGNTGVRPVLYLSSTVKITGGSGTDVDPYTLAY